jgi:hypothetical protein
MTGPSCCGSPARTMTVSLLQKLAIGTMLSGSEAWPDSSKKI